MPPLNTEAQNGFAAGLDLKPPRKVLAILHAAQIAAAECVKGAIPQIEKAAAIVARTLASGGKLVYAAAGSSGLMALADGLELPGTFGIANHQIIILLAGGKESLSDLAGGPEDDAAQAEGDVRSAGLAKGDCLISLSASGTTLYALSAAQTAKELGATTIGIANNDQTELLQQSDVAILLQTPAEIIAGSTRMGAATAQKITLNMISTLAAIHLGHVHDGHMVNVYADNIKLKHRARGIVSAISDCGEEEAARYLENAGGSVKMAILLGAGAKDIDHATQLLESTAKKLRPALSIIEGTKGS